MTIKKYNVIIIGSGAAAYSTADWLQRAGVEDIAVLTEGRECGTSRNVISDSQVYYKLAMSGENDSVSAMACSLYAGCSMDGDMARVEAEGSARCFLRLAEYGVPFPRDSAGFFVGCGEGVGRTVSAGRLMSRYMTNVLEKNVFRRGITFLDKYLAVRIVKDADRAVGVVAVGRSGKIVGFAANYIVLAIGAPSCVYSDNVYPVGQTGGLGLAIDVGAEFVNMQEWVYGIGAREHKVKLSGAYQQVMPRYYSVDSEGNEYDFLVDELGAERAINMTFLKGEKWQFDVRSMDSGPSVVDIAVYKECRSGRRVYIDYRTNPTGFCKELLSTEARNYLQDVDLISALPIKRLEKVNREAINMCADLGIDLYNEPIEIAICAQHMNGGVKVDKHWQTSVTNLFAVGEIAGIFGTYIIDGASLNDTQVGGLHIAEYIKTDMTDYDCDGAIGQLISNAVALEKEYIAGMADNVETGISFDLSREMSIYAGMVRDLSMASGIMRKLIYRIENFAKLYCMDSTDGECVKKMYKDRDRLLSQQMVLRFIMASFDIGSRGGAILTDGTSVRYENKAERDRRLVYDGYKFYSLPCVHCKPRKGRTK